MIKSKEKISLGLRENWQQFSLLVLVNMMVGGHGWFGKNRCPIGWHRRV
jgi:hypothetical protein